MIGERVSYCFNKLWPDAGPATSELALRVDVHAAGAARLAATPPPTFSCQAYSSRRAACRASLEHPLFVAGAVSRERPPPTPGQQAAAGLQAVGRGFRVRRSSSEPPPVSSPGGMVAAPANQVGRCFFGFGGRAGASSGGRAFASASAARSRKCLLLYVPFSSKLRRALSLFERCLDLTPSSPEHLRGIVGCECERDASWTRGRRAPARQARAGTVL